LIRKLNLLAVLGFVALAAPAVAQMEMPPGHDMMFRREMEPPSPEMEKKIAEHRAQMARDLHTVLRLRPDQEGAFQAYQAALGPPRFEPPPFTEDGPPVTTPERLDRMDRMRAEMEAHRAKADAATRTFYAALSPEQQQVFDALERLGGPHGPGGGLHVFARRLPPGGPGD
jgi:hypothetical protein